ncbi:hypothetical protein ACWEVM_09510 [Streptomyces bauhiniae]|uniref:hypothetical protein n=1 Tax=Streptomyces bauhiniae TaxID=2340725 RepID=UPI0036934836
MTDTRLPEGWTLQRIRDVSGDQEAVVLGTDRVVRLVLGTLRTLRPELVLGFHSLCIVKPLYDADWYMGSLHADGSVDCWTAYGDLHEALRGL